MMEGAHCQAHCVPGIANSPSRVDATLRSGPGYGHLGIDNGRENIFLKSDKMYVETTISN